MRAPPTMDPSTAAEEAKSHFLQGNTEEAFRLLDALHFQGLHPFCDDTYVLLLQHCTSTKSLSIGRILHTHISKHRFKPSSTLNYTLFSMYSKCGSLAEGRAAFDNMTQRNVVAWTFMINEYAKQGPSLEALLLYQQMLQEGASPNKVTYLCVLRACSSHGVLCQGKLIHVHIILSFLGSDVSLGNALIEMYAKCGDVKEAHHEFDLLQERTIVSWNTLIAGYVKHMDFQSGFSLFIQMENEGVDPDSITHLSIIKACAASKDILHSRLIHCSIVQLGFEIIAYVGNALVDMYCKCESLEDARSVFQDMDQPQLEAWNSLIAGCAQLGHAEEAFELFNAMKRRRLEPGKVTFLSILKACAALTALEQGIAIHILVKRHGLESDLFVASNLVDMHSKCGNLEEAHAIFDKMSAKSIVTWNTLISGYALYGQSEDVFKLISQMEREGMHLNYTTFVGLLFACSHAGLVREGCECLEIMIKSHHLQALMEHYCCMVDIFGRAGRLEEAVHVVKSMPFEPNSAIWKALLGACRVCSDLASAKHAAASLEMPDNGAFVLLSNIYAAGDVWREDMEV